MKKGLHQLLIIFCLLCFSLVVVAQPKSGTAADPVEAAEHYKHENYVMALPLYLQLLKKEPTNYEYNYRAGICYLKNHTVSKSEAIKYFEFCTKQPKADNDAWFYLGKAYHLANRFDDAIKAFETYKTKETKDKEMIAATDLAIMQCKNAKTIIKNPLNVTFTSLGKEINSEFPDYYPFVTSDESMIVFTSRRKGNIGATQVEMDGYYASDIYYSKSVNGVYTKAKNAGPSVNGMYDEQCVGLSATGSWMTVYIDNINTAGDLYESNFKTSFSKPVKLDDQPLKADVNINSGFESAGSFGPEDNIFIFSSDRPGGQGGSDLYISRKLPNGKWGVPQNLGDVVNTPYDEDFPYMAPDGKTLYFSSQGHKSMGGFDIFMTTWDQENNKWSVPRNIGYPINNADDNMSICFTEANRVAYVSTVREGGQGDLDIWRVVFNDVQENTFTLVTGQITAPDPTVPFADVQISVANAATNEEYGIYKPNPTTGKYVLALPPGKYVLTIDAPGCKQLIETMIVFDIGPQGEMTKDLVLVK